ncbi:hypothetical protein Hanom_Chr01g00054821 [Helianthus anomalus]
MVLVAMMVAAARVIAVVVKFGNCSLVVDRMGRWGLFNGGVAVVVVVAAAAAVVVKRAEGEKLMAMEFKSWFGFWLSCLWVCLSIKWNGDKSLGFFSYP